MPFLTGCTTIKVPAEFVYKEVETRNFTLASRQKVTNPAAPYKIYIEGDGYAFNARGKATQDQTPRGTLVRELAFGDDSPNVIYFARPCQYIKSPICSKRHWTTARFALEVINAEYEAIKNIADNNPVKTPDYANMSLRDELQTRFDLDELNNLQQKYGVQQTSALKSQITASSPQSSYVQPISSQQPNSQPSTWDNTLRKAEQLTTAALDGLSLGWTDELEGAASAVGYGLASLNPQWDKTNESFWDAMKRGYVKGRDNRRQVLAQGLQENPTTTTINPFYYGEMKTKREIIKHVYPTLISQELWEQCQKQKALNNHNGAELKYSQKPFVLRGLITCGRTGRVCPCEDQLRRKYYSWVVCYTKTGQRRYIPEQDVLSAIETVLNRIKIPDSLINPLYEEIKNAEISEKQYCQQEIGKLRQEQEKLKAKLDNLFDLRLDGELGRETFETKRNEIQLKIDRMGRKIKTYEKTGNAFTSTILDLINLASQAGRVFAKSDNLELKHLLLKFVFKEMILTEGELTYELNFPFSEFEKAYFYEKRSQFFQGSQDEENQGFEDNKTDENAKSFGPKIALKNQRVASKNATLLQSGCPICTMFEKISLIYKYF